MKRSDITPGQVVSKLSYRDSRQGHPVLILSTDSYERHWRTHTLTNQLGARLVQGDYRRSAVGLLAVSLAFDMHSGTGDEGDGPPLDVLEFRAKVERVRELVSIPAAIAAIEQRAREGFLSEHNPLVIRDAEGTVVGSYELLTGLQMIAGEYVALTLAERRRTAQSAQYAAEAEQERQSSLATYRNLAARLEALGLGSYRVEDWQSPTRAPELSFARMESLITAAEYAVNHDHVM